VSAPGAVARRGPCPLPVVRACDLPQRAEEARWLVEDLWPLQGVGIIGGAAKSYKTWMALDLAVSVGTGTPCLGRFPSRRGRALVYAAEDSLVDLRRRLEGLAALRRLRLAELDLVVITVPELLLDRERDLAKLEATLEQQRPTLLVLDPFVRLHSALDENSAGDVAAVLRRLRVLQRRHGVGVVLVHHARKHVAGLRAGQALRGSTDFHAWADVTLYMRREGEGATLHVEHRSARSPGPMALRLAGRGDCLGLQVLGAGDPGRSGSRGKTGDENLKAQILASLRAAPAPLSQAKLRLRIRARNERIGEALRVLKEQGLVRHGSRGWEIRPEDDPGP